MPVMPRADGSRTLRVRSRRRRGWIAWCAELPTEWWRTISVSEGISIGRIVAQVKLPNNPLDIQGSLMFDDEVMSFMAERSQSPVAGAFLAGGGQSPRYA